MSDLSDLENDVSEIFKSLQMACLLVVVMSTVPLLKFETSNSL